jgi:hypothetical protein
MESKASAFEGSAKAKPGQTHRFAPTASEYAGFCRGRPVCLPLTYVVSALNLCVCP